MEKIDQRQDEMCAEFLGMTMRVISQIVSACIVLDILDFIATKTRRHKL